MSVEVVAASEEHLEAIAAIYAKAAAETHVTFDVEGPSVEGWRQTLAAAERGEGNELLVALEDGGVLGYAKTSLFKERPGYLTTREVSAYVHEDHRGRGVGDALYAELLARLDSCAGLRMAVAGIALPNDASIALHVKHDFTVVGTFDDAGEKFGRRWSVRWYQRPLGGAGT
jgi:phosphinothricin acetyltransferase